MGTVVVTEGTDDNGDEPVTEHVIDHAEQIGAMRQWQEHAEERFDTIEGSIGQVLITLDELSASVRGTAEIAVDALNASVVAEEVAVEAEAKADEAEEVAEDADDDSEDDESPPPPPDESPKSKVHPWWK